MVTARSCTTLLALVVTVVPIGGCRRRLFVEPHTGIRFVRIEPGTFRMGSPPTERERRGDEVAHPVTLTKPFLFATTEVTQAQWVRVMGSNPSHFRGNAAAPVERVSWFEVQEFIRRLNRLTNGHYRLPTEAEWEYACRAGSLAAYARGDGITTADANYDGRRTAAVASYRPNAWGIYDMEGNVWEWCADEYCPYPPRATDPFQRCGSPYKVIRGGSWYFGADAARCATRYTHEPQLRGFSIGFRLAR